MYPTETKCSHFGCSWVCFWWRRLSGDRTVVNFTMWSWVGLNVFMLIWRECLVLGDVRPVSIATSEHGVGWGGGGMGWANNVHVGCRKDVMLRHATSFRFQSLRQSMGWGGVGGGWGGLITFMSAAGRMWCYGMLRCEDVEVTSNGVGWGGGGGLITFMSAAGWMWCYVMLRCEDVEVTSGTLWMLRCEDVEVTSGTLWMLRCEDVEVTSGTLWMLRCEDVEVTSGTLWMLRCEDVGLDLLQELGKLMKSINKKIGYWKWADRRCKKASNVFREYVFEIHFFQKSRFRYSENDTKLILRRASNVFEPFFNIDRARFMNKVLRFTGNCALNL